MDAKVDLVHLVEIGDTRWWHVVKPDAEMRTGAYVHHSALDKLLNEVKDLRASLSRQVPLDEFEKLEDRAMAAEASAWKWRGRYIGAFAEYRIDAAGDMEQDAVEAAHAAAEKLDLLDSAEKGKSDGRD